MKILLIVPAVPRLRVAHRDRRVPSRAWLRFSILPLTTVAALTPEHHQVEVCDENVEPVDLASDADLVGLSLMTATAPRGYELARWFRGRGKTVVAGGYHPTLCPDETLAHVDAVVAGDAEDTWPRLLEDLEAGRLQRLYRSQGTGDLARVPVPRRALAARNARHYVTPYAVQSGRGCRHGCRYCSITAFHRRTYRTRPLEAVLDELRGIPRDLIFVDDNIISDPDHARRLFTAMVPLRKRWVSQCSLAIADDPELLALARAAGCRGLFIGVETADAGNLDRVDKGFNQADRHLERLAAVRRAGIGVIAGMIVGMDGDDPRVFERTLRFLQRAGVDALQLNIMTPLPGTPLFDDLRRAGRIVDRDWGHYDFRHCVFRPARMTRAELQDGADWLYRQFYRLDRVIVRCLRTLWVSGPVPAYVGWRLAMTYRYDNRRERIRGRNPAAAGGRAALLVGRLRCWPGRARGSAAPAASS